MYYMHICVLYIYILLCYMYAYCGHVLLCHVCKGWKSVSGVFFYFSSLEFLRQGPSLNLDLTRSTGLAGQ